ncbi:MAG: hypothetical protein D6685_09265 [Bacteroidetes bacterium]|nr:MAG: hypothetical protein D6685_09265 [Bacteroidota bacterium]
MTTVHILGLPSEAMLARLYRIRAGLGATLEAEDLDYWGERFQALRLRFWAGCLFSEYLAAPMDWEEVARREQERYRRAAVKVRALYLIGEGRRGPSRLIIYQN